jgi:hypothetical protein
MLLGQPRGSLATDTVCMGPRVWVHAFVATLILQVRLHFSDHACERHVDMADGELVGCAGVGSTPRSHMCSVFADSVSGPDYGDVVSVGDFFVDRRCAAL